MKIFGKLTDIFQAEEYVLNEKISNVSELKNKLETIFPELKSFTYLTIINNAQAQEEEIIPQNAEIALLPPYSGG